MTAPTVNVERRGVGYLLTWPDWDLRAKVDRLREEKGQLRGQLTLHHIVGDSPKLLYHGNINLSSQRTRKETAKALETEFGNKEWHPSWTQVLEQLFNEVWDRENQGEPLRIIAGDPDDYPISLRYVIHPLVFVGQATMLFGEGGLAKSWFALYCGLLASLGMSQNGLRTTPGSVVILDWETSQEELNRRVWLLKQGGSIPKEAEVLYRRCYRSLSDELEEIVEQVQGCNAQMVVIDSLLGACGGEDLEKSQSAGHFFNAFRRLNTAGLIITHTQKGEGKKSAFGSAYWQSQARSVWMATGIADQGGDSISLGLLNVKVNMGRLRLPLAYRLSFQRGSVSPSGDDTDDVSATFHWEDAATAPQTQEGQPAWIRIKNAIQETDTSVSSVSDLSVSTGIPADTVRMNLNRHKDKFLKRGQIGREDLWGVVYQ